MKNLLLYLAGVFAGAIILEAGFGRDTWGTVAGLAAVLFMCAFERWMDADEKRYAATTVTDALGAQVASLTERLQQIDNRTQVRLSR